MTPTPTALLVAHIAIDLILLSSCYILAKKHYKQYNRPHLAMMAVSTIMLIVAGWTLSVIL